MENVHFDWFNQYFCTGEHLQSDLEIFQFDFMFVKAHDVPLVLCFNVQTEMRFGVEQLLFTTPTHWKQELFYSKSHLRKNTSNCCCVIKHVMNTKHVRHPAISFLFWTMNIYTRGYHQLCVVSTINSKYFFGELWYFGNMAIQMSPYFGLPWVRTY